MKLHLHLPLQTKNGCHGNATCVIRGPEKGGLGTAKSYTKTRRGQPLWKTRQRQTQIKPRHTKQRNWKKRTRADKIGQALCRDLGKSMENKSQSTNVRRSFEADKSSARWRGQERTHFVWGRRMFVCEGLVQSRIEDHWIAAWCFSFRWLGCMQWLSNHVRSCFIGR